MASIMNGPMIKDECAYIACQMPRYPFHAVQEKGTFAFDRFLHPPANPLETKTLSTTGAVAHGKLV